MENEKAIMTNGVPQCPHCKKPTERSGSSGGFVTAAYYRPHYDKNGKNINPDRNTSTSKYTCLDCGTPYTVASRGGESWYK